MKLPIFATLAMFWLAAPALAQPQAENGTATVQPDLNAQGNLAGPHRNETSGGDKDNPAPHIYKRGEHISPSYGEFSSVTDWGLVHLSKPPAGSHWVKFADNYLLVSDTSGVITDIVKAS